MNPDREDGGRTRLTLIAAMSPEGVIGKGNRLPWRLPADLAHFRRLTIGHAVIMGRRCHESIGRPLPGRRNIVLSRNPGYRAPGCEVAPSLERALAMTRGDSEVFIIGGAELYAQTIGRADRLCLTRVAGHFDGDAHFPPIPWGRWRETGRVDHPPDEQNPYALTFLDLEPCREGRP